MKPALICALALVACKGDAKKSPEPEVVAGKPAEPGVKPQPTLIRRDAVEEVLRVWLDTQNKGDLAGYSALYAENFRGVRRTGEKRVSLDRAGWLADRERMFRRPMVVVARDVTIAVGPKGAEIRLTQDWTSGTYRDVGPKEIRLGESGGKLLIVREEMLQSTVVGTGDLPVASARLALIYGGDLVVAGSPDLTWGAGEATLESGEIVEQPKHCENSPDYETEHDRYWECHNTEPGNVTGQFSASQKLDRARAGPLIRHWRGKKLALYGATGKLCDATVRGLELWAEIKTTQEAVTRGGSIAEAVMTQSNPIIIGDLDKPCRGALYARDPDLEPPPAWAIGPAPPALQKTVTAELDKLTAGDVFDADGSAPEIAAKLLAPPSPGGRRFIHAVKTGVESCSSYNRAAAVWEIKGNQLELVGEASELGDLTAAADTDGDGAPELIFARGFLVWGEDGYAEVRPIDFPDLVVPCICECE